LAEVLGRTRADQFDSCEIDLILSNGLRGNSRLESFSHFPGIDIRNRQCTKLQTPSEKTKASSNGVRDVLIYWEEETWSVICIL
jgi:hypothetical protein